MDIELTDREAELMEQQDLSPVAEMDSTQGDA